MDEQEQSFAQWWSDYPRQILPQWRGVCSAAHEAGRDDDLVRLGAMLVARTGKGDLTNAAIIAACDAFDHGRGSKMKRLETLLSQSRKQARKAQGERERLHRRVTDLSKTDVTVLQEMVVQKFTDAVEDAPSEWDRGWMSGMADAIRVLKDRRMDSALDSAEEAVDRADRLIAKHGHGDDEGDQ